MAFTTPRTWVAGEKPTAATMNTHIRDNFDALGGVWTSYTPTIVGTASPTLACQYAKVNKIVTVEFSITLTAVVTASLTMSLPSSSAAAVRTVLGAMQMTDISASLGRLGNIRQASATTVDFAFENATPALVPASASQPFTWASGDEIRGMLTYREA